MVICPKCGGSNIGGPNYQQSAYGGRGMLKWVCLRCGFASYSNTRDEQRDATLDRIRKEQGE